MVGWSDREHLFVPKEKEVSGILWELLKQKLSRLLAPVHGTYWNISDARHYEYSGTQTTDEYPTPMIFHGQLVGLRLVLLTQD